MTIDNNEEIRQRLVDIVLDFLENSTVIKDIDKRLELLEAGEMHYCDTTDNPTTKKPTGDYGSIVYRPFSSGCSEHPEANCITMCAHCSEQLAADIPIILSEDADVIKFRNQYYRKTCKPKPTEFSKQFDGYICWYSSDDQHYIRTEWTEPTEPKDDDSEWLTADQIEKKFGMTILEPTEPKKIKLTFQVPGKEEKVIINIK